MVSDFKKIELHDSRPSRRRKGGAVKMILIGIVVLLLLIIAAGGLLAYSLSPLLTVKDKAMVLMSSAKELSSDIKSQDLEKAKKDIEKVKTDLSEVDTQYGKVRNLSVVPFLGAYIQDGDHMLKAAKAGVSAGEQAIAAIEPNADLLGLKGGSKFVAGSADERIQVAVKTMEALTPKINEMSKNIDIIRKEISDIDPARYPENFRGQVIRQRIVDTKNVIEDASNLFVNAQPLLMNLPKILGEPKEKRYLVIFQNDKELRPTGGFMTAYAQFRLARGKMILEKAEDIYSLDAALSKTFPAPPEILKFHKGVFQFNIRDSNLSPDYKISMKQFESMYDYVRGKEDIDGIIALDTDVLVQALKILGPMTLHDDFFGKDRVFSGETDKRCDCPRAVYELEDYSTRPVGTIRTDRKGIIGTLLRDLMQKALGVSPSKYWGSLFQMLLTEINKKHVLAYFHDADSQRAVESFNMAGRIMTASETAALLAYKEGKGWDYLHINNSNMAGAKSNMFVSDKFTKDTTVNSDGTVTTKLTIDYKNPYHGSDCGLESGGLCLNAPLRNWLRIYVPKGSKLTGSKGTQSPKSNEPEAMTTYDSLEKTVFEGFLIINPLGTARVELTYTSPVKSEDGKYHLLIQKQPGTDGTEVTLKMNGSEKKKFVLEADTEVVL